MMEDKKVNVTEWPVEELKRVYIALYDAIEIADTFDGKDLELYYAIEHELNSRGYEIIQQPPKIEKKMV